MRAALGAALALVLTAGASTGTPPPPTPPPATPPGADGAGSRGEGRLITLVTGDRVLVGAGEPGRESVTMLPGPDSPSDAVRIRRTADRTYVVPAAAQPFLTAGTLDPGLFDVTGLVAQGYGDADRPTLPLIVQYSGARAAARELPGATVTTTLDSIDAVAVEQDRDAAAQFWSAFSQADGARGAGGAISHVWLDGTVRASLDESVPQIGAPRAWEDGHAGAGAVIAILDTGVDATHPDLAGKVVAEQNFSTSPDTVDRAGHGTHVASTAAGTGAASDGSFRGVAPEAKLLSGKVLDDYGFGQMSDVIAGMEWAVEQGADVVNLSLSSEPTDGRDPAALAVDRLTEEAGVLFVTSAGNEGPGAETVASPATADAALAVGAVDGEDVLAPFSSRGPRLTDGAIKPEISAPGVEITAARSTTIDDGGDEAYLTMDGTSMAAPHVAGAAAILAGQHPDWSAAQLRAVLMSTAAPAPAISIYEQGAGRVDVAAAATVSVVPSVGELEFGYHRWPHDDVELVTREVTYTNVSDAPVTLDLAVTATGAEPPPAGAITVTPSELTIPAGGAATAAVTTDATGLDPGHYEAAVVATDRATQRSVRIPAGWYVEAERYDVTVRLVDRAGAPASGEIEVVDVDQGTWTVEPVPDGTATLRLPPGTYSFGSFLYRAAEDDRAPEYTLVTDPEIEVAGATEVTLDAQGAEPVRTTVRGAEDATPRWSMLGYARGRAQDELALSSSLEAIGADYELFAVPTEPVASGAFFFDTGVRLEEPPIRAEVPGTSAEIETAYYEFSQRIDGTLRLPVVDVGTATAAELSDTPVDGAIALAVRDPERDNGEQAADLERAGARAVLFYDPQRAGVRTQWLYPLVDIPVIGTSRTAAARLRELLADGSVELELTGSAVTPYVYDLLVPAREQVPERPRWQFRRSDLATIDVRFGAHAPTSSTSETRQGRSPSGNSIGGWMLPFVTAPSERTDHVLANEVTWWQQVLPHNADDGAPSWSEIPRTYRPRQRDDVQWMSPVATQSLPDRESPDAVVERYGDTIWALLGGFVHDPGHVQMYGSALEEYALRLYRDGELLGEVADRGGLVDVPAGPGTFRLELDGRFEQSWWIYSTQVSSAWTFHSAGDDGDGERLPLLVADYDVPGADALGTVPADRPVRIDVGLRHQAGSSGAEIDDVELEVSVDDGATWTPAQLRGADGRYRATVDAGGEPGGAVTLRITATDVNGGRLEQTVVRAFGLR
ncbi:S8 family serine peptidase [Jiangella sp. DSM 45060]|uniref:S8 family serine peptidase n=1 Tax=Jiangella sp. DSM 45060 TaxID=1798224 RepID=UPI000879D6D3|nr:S8 family serine peptidase [Jiangella sp. DSM 45060]SDT31388.1 Serine protease, subtilisin family [Jiangella sp. DSM 45060]